MKESEYLYSRRFIDTVTGSTTDGTTYALTGSKVDPASIKFLGNITGLSTNTITKMRLQIKTSSSGSFTDVDDKYWNWDIRDEITNTIASNNDNQDFVFSYYGKGYSEAEFRFRYENNASSISAKVNWTVLLENCSYELHKKDSKEE